jgi:phosphate uptake regulator
MAPFAIRTVACAPDVPRLPKRLARARRNIESKRIENFKKIHEELKRVAKEEQDMLRDFFKSFQTPDDDEEVKKDDE